MKWLCEAAKCFPHLALSCSMLTWNRSLTLHIYNISINRGVLFTCQNDKTHIDGDNVGNGTMWPVNNSHSFFDLFSVLSLIMRIILSSISAVALFCKSGMEYNYNMTLRWALFQLLNLVLSWISVVYYCRTTRIAGLTAQSLQRCSCMKTVPAESHRRASSSRDLLSQKKACSAILVYLDLCRFYSCSKFTWTQVGTNSLLLSPALPLGSVAPKWYLHILGPTGVAKDVTYSLFAIPRSGHCT